MSWIRLYGMDSDQGMLFSFDEEPVSEPSRSARSGPKFREPLEFELFPAHPSSDIPEDHLVRKIWASVCRLDLSRLKKTYARKGGYPYEPEHLLAAVLYGMTEGVRSEDALAQHCIYDLRYRFLVGGHHPSASTFGRFLRRMSPFLDEILAQVIREARGKGLGGSTEVAIDGCRVPGNTSWWNHRKDSTQKPSDPDARLMNSHGRPMVGYSVHIAVDPADGLIVGADVNNLEADWHAGPALIRKMEEQSGQLPCAVIADSGYESPSTIVELGEMGVDTVIAVRAGLNEHVHLNEHQELVCPCGKLIVQTRAYERNGVGKADFRPEGGCRGCPLKECLFRGKKIQLSPGDDPSAKYRNQQRVESEQYRGAMIRRRTVERAFACLRRNDGFDRFHRRGLGKVRSEFLLWVTSYNMRRVYGALLASLASQNMQISFKWHPILSPSRQLRTTEEFAAAA